MVFDFIWQTICYFVGYWSLKLLSLGKFQDQKGSVLVSLFGLLVIVVVALIVYFFLKE